MKICIIGKYPPIEGGVSARTYWLAHDLAILGHQIFVVTNANECNNPYKIKLEADDLPYLEKTYLSGGSVKVFWTNDELEKQYHIPWHNPFVTKLASKALAVNQQYTIDLFFSYYLEPYAIAGYLASQLTNKPHIIKHAGSDMGSLYNQQDFKELYLQILKQAHAIVTGKAVAAILAHDGVPKNKLALGFPTKLATAFNPSGHVFPWKKTSNTKVIGIYGKISAYKGTFELLQALQLLLKKKQQVRLVIVGSGESKEQRKLQNIIKKLALEKTVTQLPYLPNWKIPAFIRSCDAVCFLEHHFPIQFHTPTVAQEVLACGVPLICSLEILQKQPLRHLLIHGYNCIAVNKVSDIKELAAKMNLVLAASTDELAYLGKNGRQYYDTISKTIPYPTNYINLFEQVLTNKFSGIAPEENQHTSQDSLLWTHTLIAQVQDQALVKIAATIKQPQALIEAVIAKLPHLIASEKQRELLLELLLFERILALNLNPNKSNHEDITESIYRGFHKIQDLETAKFIIEMLKINVCYQGFKCQFNVAQLLKARQQHHLPQQLGQQNSMVLIFQQPVTSSIKVLSLSSKEWEVIQAIATRSTQFNLSQHKTFIIKLIILGFLKIT